MPPRAIAIDLDDTLNNFTATLQAAEFPRGPDEPVPVERAEAYLRQVRGIDPEAGDLLSTEYTFFRARVHLHCYRQAQPRADGVEFVRRLHREGWRIVICTRRDLRRAQAPTRDWLAAHGIPFHHLFMAGNKIVFCRLWDIPVLVDDDLFNIAHGGTYGVRVFYPRLPKHAGVMPNGARGFASFGELYPWIHESSS